MKSLKSILFLPFVFLVFSLTAFCHDTADPVQNSTEVAQYLGTDIVNAVLVDNVKGAPEVYEYNSAFENVAMYNTLEFTSQGVPSILFAYVFDAQPSNIIELPIPKSKSISLYIDLPSNNFKDPCYRLLFSKVKQ
jgi:hypothetical protein